MSNGGGIFRDCCPEDWELASREASPSFWNWLKGLFRR